MSAVKFNGIQCRNAARSIARSGESSIGRSEDGKWPRPLGKFQFSLCYSCLKHAEVRFFDKDSSRLSADTTASLLSHCTNSMLLIKSNNGTCKKFFILFLINQFLLVYNYGQLGCKISSCRAIITSCHQGIYPLIE